MTRKKRRIIFYLFLVFFIILVPIIILYARGYAFDWEEKEIVATGGIYLKSYPTKAETYLDNKLKGKTNKFLMRLIPKNYTIKIVKENYHIWQKDLIVKPELITKADNILLLPLNPKIALVATESQEYLAFFKEDAPFSLTGIPYSTIANYLINKDEMIFLDSTTEMIYKMELNTFELEQMFDQVFPSFKNCKWTLSNDEKKILCKKDKSIEILWLAQIINNLITREKGEVEKIYFNEKINDAIWYSGTDEHLILSTVDSIIITELDNRPPRNTINFLSAENANLKYDPKTKTLYFLSQDRLYQTEL